MKSLIPPLALVCLLPFSSCEKAQPDAMSSGLSDEQAIERAKGAAQESFARLSAELKAAIEADGTAAAIGVCSERAPAVLAEVSAEMDLGVTRISDKPRNFAHGAVGLDMAAIEYFREKIAENEESVPQVESYADGSKTVRLPIVISQPLCLQCHGTEAEIAKDTLAAISAAYPQDQARGYQLGDLRGIWKVEIPPSK